MQKIEKFRRTLSTATMFRIETDSIGQIQVPSDSLWGSQTQRSLQYFNIGDEKEKMPIELIRALIEIKRAAAIVNSKNKKLDKSIASAIIQACDHILSKQKEYESQFPLKIWQTGSGTQTNMNVNEVLANIASKSSGIKIHPNDHLNMGQSSNDTIPSAMQIALILEYKNRLKPELHYLVEELNAFINKYGKEVKIGRTHMQDATPITIGQEFGAFVSQIKNCILALDHSSDKLSNVPQGGTAVGTGVNTFKGFDIGVCEELSLNLGVLINPASNKFEYMAMHDIILNFDASINILASSLFKIANDIRLMSSGPRCGLNELNIPSNEPGSSIMPGKVNPTQCEAVTMICIQVMGNHFANTIANSQGHFQLNVYKPLIFSNSLRNIRLLADVINSFSKYCISGCTPNSERLKNNIENSFMLATSLSPKLGYDMTAKIIKKAYLENISLKDAAVSMGSISNDEFKKIVDPKKMLEPYSLE